MKKLWFSNLAMMLGCLSAATASGQYPGAYGSLAPSGYPAQYPQAQMGFQAFPQAPQMPNAPGPMPSVAAPMPAAPYQVSGASNPTYSSPTPTYDGMNPSHQVGPMQVQAYNQAGMPSQPVDGMWQQGWYGQGNAPFQLTSAQENVSAQPAPSPAGQIPLPMATPMQAGPRGPLQGAPQSIVEGAAPEQRTTNGPVNGAYGAVQHQGHAHNYQAAPNAPMMNPVYGQSIAPGCTSCGSAPLAESYAYPMYAPQAQAPHFGGRLHHAARGSFFTGMPADAKPYFGGGSVLLFHRVDDDNAALTYDVNMPTDNALGTRDARSGLMPGFEVFLGRYFNCGRNAATISYWGIYPEEQMATVTTGGGSDLRSRYHFTDIAMPAVGAYAQESAYNWYDMAQAHRIDRSSDYHNIEANLLGFSIGGAARSFYLPTSGSMFSGVRGARGGMGGCGYCGGSGCGMCGSQGDCGGNCGDCNSCQPTRFATGPCCLTPGCGSRLNLTWLTGVRYFRFEDNLTYAASRADYTFGSGNDDIYYDSQVTNDLVGGQIGGTLNYCTGKRASLYATTKLGVYGNHSQFNSSLGTRNNSAYVSSGPYNGNNYVISASKTDVAFIGELGCGINYRLTSKWSANVGYRAIAASGVATAVDQLPLQMSHLGNAANFDNNSSLILHGVNLGAQYNY